MRHFALALALGVAVCHPAEAADPFDVSIRYFNAKALQINTWINDEGRFLDIVDSAASSTSGIDFADANVEGYEPLFAEIDKNEALVFNDADRDGVDQIAYANALPANLSIGEDLYLDNATSRTSEVFVIDTGVENYGSLVDELIDEIDVNAEFVYIDTSRDGMEQIAEVLATLSESIELDAIHIISQGDAGKLYLGNTVLSLETILGEHADELALIRYALPEEADILIYGCDFAFGEIGISTATALADLSGADIAASVDHTGHASVGGDWQLEFVLGKVDTRTVNLFHWHGSLAPIGAGR
jgi:hypothetical protein